jgi:hypothetical protein
MKRFNEMPDCGGLSPLPEDHAEGARVAAKRQIRITP